MNTRSATWTPPSPLPTMAPATTKIAIPGVVDGSARATTPRVSPTTHEARTAISVRFGPYRSTSRPQPNAGQDRHDDEHQRDVQELALGQTHPPDRHDAHHDDERVDRIGVEEPPDQEPEEPRHLACVPDRDHHLAEASRAASAQVTRSVPGGGVGSLTTRKIGHREDREEDPGDREDRVGRLGDPEQRAGRPPSAASRRSRRPPRSRTAGRASPGSSPRPASRRSR